MRRKSKDKTLDEILTYGYMPERFSTGYLELVRSALQVDPNVQTYDNESAKHKRPFRSPTGGIKDENALRFKAWVDRQLRAVGRDIQAYLNARDGNGPSPIGVPDNLRREIAREIERKTELKCKSGNCGKYISWQWKHCAWCGKEIVDASVQGQSRSGSDGQQTGSSSEPETAAHIELLVLGAAGQDPDGESGGSAGQRADGEEGNSSESRQPE